MYIPQSADYKNTNRVTFDSDVMELIEAFAVDNDSMSDYRFMFEHIEWGYGEGMRSSFRKSLFNDKRWNDLIVSVNAFICSMTVECIVIDGNDHIFINGIDKTEYRDDSYGGYESAVQEYISMIQSTDVERFGGNVFDVRSCVNALNRFIRIVRIMNESDS